MATTMTEIPIKDLPLTTAPAGKQLLVRDASAGLQRIDYDQIAKNLVESYGSSSLAGKNQSIKAAIDSLNSGLTQKFPAFYDSRNTIKIITSETGIKSTIKINIKPHIFALILCEFNNRIGGVYLVSYYEVNTIVNGHASISKSDNFYTINCSSWSTIAIIDMGGNINEDDISLS